MATSSPIQLTHCTVDLERGIVGRPGPGSAETVLADTARRVAHARAHLGTTPIPYVVGLDHLAAQLDAALGRY